MSLALRGFQPNEPVWNAHWPNRQTIFTSGIVITNLACHFLKCSLVARAAIILPLRSVAICQTPVSQRNYALPLSVAALIVLPFRYGIIFSICLDITSEIFNFHHRHVGRSSYKPHVLSSQNRLDPKDFINACKILNVPPNTKDTAHVKAQYEIITQGLRERQKKVSPLFAGELQRLIDDAQTAYDTIVRSITAANGTA